MVQSSGASEGILSGMRIVELSTNVAGAYAGRLLAMYGADVVMVEPDGGHALRHLPPWAGDTRDPEDSILFAYLGAGKRSVRLDLHTPDGLETARRLVATADAVIDTHAPGELAALGLDLDAAAEQQRALVVTQVTPYGQTGPKAHWRATSLTAYAAGGQMNGTGDGDQPPLKTAGHQAFYQAALHAFSATLTALYAARTSGVGDVIDISVQEVGAAKLEGSLPNALTRGTEAGRTAGNATFAQWGIHPTADWWIGVAAMPRQSFAVYDLIGRPELKEDPEFRSGWSPAANEVLSVLVPEWISQRTAEEVFALADQYRTPMGMIPTPAHLLEWQHFQETGFWRHVDHPRLGRHPLPAGPVQFGADDRGAHGPAPRIGEHTAEVQDALPPASKPAPASTDGLRPPLEGVRVIDVTQVWAGPYATRLLGDAGAEVIKVEGPTFEDPVRTMAGTRDVPGINQSAYFNEYNRNKLGVSIDLKTEEGMEALRRMLATADVFIENWSSGVAERIGLGYEAVKAIKPDIVYVSMPGFGHRGPDARRVGFGPTIEQMGGLVALQGYEGGAPHRSGISYGDPIAGAVASGAVVAGLLRRQRTGEGIYIMVPQRDGIVGLIGEYIVAEALGSPLPTRIGSKDAYFAPHNVYPARDTEPRPVLSPLTGEVMGAFTDAWVTIAVDSEEAWDALRRVVGDERLGAPAYASMEARRQCQDEIDAVISEWTRHQDAEEAAAALQAAGVAAERVLTPLTMTTDAHMAARDNWATYDHPDTGVAKTLRSVWRMRRRPQGEIRHAPQFGGDSESLLARFGFTPDEIEAMKAKGVTTTELAS
ncbi:MAG: CoA transferase [Dehalococcoidia bacterium]|nr:CoA transferase [Dehalococcoidia bacterium]